MAWCATLPAGTPFHGLCRVHHIELLGLGGAWDEATAEAVRACRGLIAYHPNMAGESFYVAGELQRLRGDLAGAEDASSPLTSWVATHSLAWRCCDSARAGRRPQPPARRRGKTNGRSRPGW